MWGSRIQSKRIRDYDGERSILGTAEKKVEITDGGRHLQENKGNSGCDSSCLRKSYSQWKRSTSDGNTFGIAVNALDDEDDNADNDETKPEPKEPKETNENKESKESKEPKEYEKPEKSKEPKEKNAV